MQHLFRIVNYKAYSKKHRCVNCIVLGKKREIFHRKSIIKKQPPNYDICKTTLTSHYDNAKVTLSFTNEMLNSEKKL